VVRGDTQFASTIAACASLPATLRRRLSALRACHRYVYRYTKPTTPLPEVEHPIIARHPYNGKPSLYVNAGFTHGIAGMDEHEGRALLQELYDHVAKPEFVYRHKWRKGDVIMWDNCATQHNAVGDYEAPLRRLMWRTTISGVGMQPSE
jgi:taurine dioxygenase